MRITLRWLLTVSLVAGIPFLAVASDSDTSLSAVTNPPTVDFASDVLPILSNKCFVCHGPDAQSKDTLRLDHRDSAMADRGGYRAVDQEHPQKSELLVRILSSDDPMPPADAEKQLTVAEREILRRWILGGGEYAIHWAFVPPRKTIPEGASTGSIDGFISAKLKQADLEFAPEAEASVLARRAALVLTGLPPEPQQLKRFLSDRRSDRYERFVDQLLASPRFGEHQARYWLDAVRYGDTHGLHLDNRRGIYPYRDWVVRAFNDNLPIDQFITWQLAGDLLPSPSLEQLVATGFVRMNPTTAEGGAIAEEFQAKNNFDRTETLGTVLLGMSLTCARCHSHKYDPISQTEYYQLFAFFNSTAEHSMDGNKYEYGPVIQAPSDQAAWLEWNHITEEQRQLVDSIGLTQIQRADLADEIKRQWSTASSIQRFELLVQHPMLMKALGVLEQAQQIKQKADKAAAKFTTTLVARERPQPRETRLLRRGEYNMAVGDPIRPDVLSIMGSLPESAPRNRLGLAKWLTSRQHPLVSRVLINRIWQRIFSDGIVRTPEDFGVQGEHPTHPQLLDWLAVEFMESGWNLKHMLKLMVTSRTFRQSSAWRNDLDDPENRRFARGPSRRLDAEVIRDIGLWSSRLLDPHMGGEGVKPYQPAGMWQAMAHPASNTKKYERDHGQRLYRRSLYVYWKRTSPHPMMTLFDAPDRESSCVRRGTTNTPLQSLGLLNETQRIEMARKLAERIIQSRRSDEARFDQLFLLLASRPPRPVELEACQRLLRQANQRYTDTPADAQALLSIGDAPSNPKLQPTEVAAWTQVAATVLASDIAIMLY